MPHKRTHSLVRLASAVAASLVMSRLSAQTVSWVNPISGDWFDGSKWSGALVPNSSVVHAVIGQAGTPYTVQINSAVSVGSLSLLSPVATLVQNGGNLSVASQLLNSSTLQFYGGTWSGSGTIVNNGTLLIGGDDTDKYSTRDIVNNGLAIVTRTLNVGGFYPVAGTITNSPGATWALDYRGFSGSVTFNNQGTFYADMVRGYGLGGQLDWGGGFTFNNTGLFLKTGGNPSWYYGVFNNSGTINALGSEIRFVGGLVNSGTIVIGGGQLTLANVPQMAGGILTGGTWVFGASGSLQITGQALSGNSASLILIPANGT